MIHSLSTRGIKIFGAESPDRMMLCATLSVAARIFLAVENFGHVLKFVGSGTSVFISFSFVVLCMLPLSRPPVFYDLFHPLLRRAVYLCCYLQNLNTSASVSCGAIFPIIAPVMNYCWLRELTRIVSPLTVLRNLTHPHRTLQDIRRNL